jgi:hypothetical protein
MGCCIRSLGLRFSASRYPSESSFVCHLGSYLFCMHEQLILKMAIWLGAWTTLRHQYDSYEI